MSEEREDAPLDGSSLPPLGKLLRAGLLSGGLGLGVVGLVWLAVSRFDLGGEDLELLQGQTRPIFLVPSILLLMSGLVCVGLRWRALVPEPKRVGRTGIFGIVCSGFLLNYALPGPAGELVSAVLLDRLYGVRISIALAASLHARVVGLATAGAIALGAWAFGALPVPEGHEGMIGAATGVLAVAVLVLGAMSAKPEIIVAVSSATAGRLGRVGGRLGTAFGKLDEAVAAVALALKSIGSLGPRAYLNAFTWSVVGYCVVALGMWAACIALGIAAYPLGLLFSHAGASAGTVVLFAFPGAQLGWDALLCAFLVGGAGISLSSALAVATVIRVQFLVAMGVGAVALFVLLPKAKVTSP